MPTSQAVIGTGNEGEVRNQILNTPLWLGQANLNYWERVAEKFEHNMSTVIFLSTDLKVGWGT